jgi:hypothetical protein
MIVLSTKFCVQTSDGLWDTIVRTESKLDVPTDTTLHSARTIHKHSEELLKDVLKVVSLQPQNLATAYGCLWVGEITNLEWPTMA